MWLWGSFTFAAFMLVVFFLSVLSSIRGCAFFFDFSLEKERKDSRFYVKIGASHNITHRLITDARKSIEIT